MSIPPIKSGQLRAEASTTHLPVQAKPKPNAHEDKLEAQLHTALFELLASESMVFNLTSHQGLSQLTQEAVLAQVGRINSPKHDAPGHDSVQWAEKRPPMPISHSESPTSERLTHEDISVIQQTILPTVEKLIQEQAAKAAQLSGAEEASAATKLTALAKAAASEALAGTRVQTQIQINGVNDTHVQVELTGDKLSVNIASLVGIDSAGLASLRDILEQKYPNLQVVIAFSVTPKDDANLHLARDSENASHHSESDDPHQHDDARDQKQRHPLDDDLLDELQ